MQSLGEPEGDVDLSRMNFEQYMRNPVVLWHHSGYSIPVAKTEEIQQRDDGQIVAGFKFNEGIEEGKKLKRSYVDGFVNAASIGWRDGKNGEPEMVEWSLVSVPVDDDALAIRSLNAGLAKTEENTMAEETKN